MPVPPKGDFSRVPLNAEGRQVGNSWDPDPQYLTQPYATTVQFKKQAGGAGWDPTPCCADEAR